MIAATSCPCCGHRVEEASDLRWNEQARSLSGRGHVVFLSPMLGKLFTALWRAWPSGHLILLDQMMEVLYADDIDGGPDTHNVVSVQINNLRKKLIPFGISVRGRHGYLLYETAAANSAFRQTRADKISVASRTEDANVSTAGRG